MSHMRVLTGPDLERALVLRDEGMPGTDVDDVDDRATHPGVFAEFDHRFGGFTLDVAAAEHNAKCERYFTREQDGQTWWQRLVEQRRDRGEGLRFLKRGQQVIGPNERPPFGVCLLIWGLDDRGPLPTDALFDGDAA